MTFKKALTVSEIAVIVIFAIVPLFLSLPYRVNIFLSWEGAYRISNGEIPFRDFGIPLGGMYWVIPAIFFKIFGPQMISLVKAQVFINIISGLAFRSVLKSLEVQPSVRFSGILLYCLSFSFINFWPWYNHTVIVYAFVALAFVIKMISFRRGYHNGFAALAKNRCYECKQYGQTDNNRSHQFQCLGFFNKFVYRHFYLVAGLILQLK